MILERPMGRGALTPRWPGATSLGRGSNHRSPNLTAGGTGDAHGWEHMAQQGKLSGAVIVSPPTQDIALSTHGQGLKPGSAKSMFPVLRDSSRTYWLFLLPGHWRHRHREKIFSRHGGPATKGGRRRSSSGVEFHRRSAVPSTSPSGETSDLRPPRS